MPIAWLVIVLIRLATGNRPSDRTLVPTLVLGGRLVIGIALLVSALDAGGRVRAVAFSTASLAVFWPTLILRYVLVPLGLARTVYYATRAVRPLTFRGRVGGGAALYACLAAARKRTLSDRLFVFLENRIESAPGSPEQATASGVLEMIQGRFDRADALFRAVRWLPGTAGGDYARALSCDFQVARQASLGNWTSVLALTEGNDLGLWSGVVRTTVLYRRRPTWLRRIELVLRWLFAPRRRALWPLVKLALAASPPQPAASAKTLPEMSTLDHARHHHARLLQLRAVSPEALESTLQAWDDAFDDRSTAASLARRALGANQSVDAASLVARLRETVLADLMEVVDARAIPLDLVRSSPSASPPEPRADAELPSVDRSSLLPELLSRARSRRLAEVTARTDDFCPHDQSAAPRGADAWIAWQKLRDACDRAVHHGVSARDLYAELWPRACNRAVSLHNLENHKVLANVVFSFLWPLARAAGNESAAALLLKNLAASA